MRRGEILGLAVRRLRMRLIEMRILRHHVHVWVVVLVRRVRPRRMHARFEQRDRTEPVMIVEATVSFFVTRRHHGEIGGGGGLCVGQEHVALFVRRGSISMAAGDRCTCSATGVRRCGGTGGAETDSFGRRVVAGIHGASLTTDEEPSHTPGDSSDEIHRVEGVSESAQSKPAALIRRLAVSVKIGDLRCLRILERIRLPGESPQVQYSEDGHFHGDQEVGKSDFQITWVKLLGSLDGTGGEEEGYHTLQKRISRCFVDMHRDGSSLPIARKKGKSPA